MEARPSPGCCLCPKIKRPSCWGCSNLKNDNSFYGNLYQCVALGLGLLWSKMVGSGKCYKAWSNQFLEFVPSSFSQKHSQNVEIWSHASPLILIPRRALVFQQISCCGRSQQFGIGHCPRSLGTSGQDCDHDSMNAFLGPFSQSLFGSHNNTL